MVYRILRHQEFLLEEAHQNQLIYALKIEGFAFSLGPMQHFTLQVQTYRYQAW